MYLNEKMVSGPKKLIILISPIPPPPQIIMEYNTVTPTKTIKTQQFELVIKKTVVV
jgi:hypothetical protein